VHACPSRDTATAAPLRQLLCCVFGLLAREEVSTIFEVSVVYFWRVAMSSSNSHIPITPTLPTVAPLDTNSPVAITRKFRFDGVDRLSVLQASPRSTYFAHFAATCAC